MSFLWPTMLWLLLLLPLCGVLYILNQRRRRRLAGKFSSLGLTDGNMDREPGIRRLPRRSSAGIHVPVMVFLIGLAILVIGLARPQASINLPRVGGTVILAFDVSNSMAAEDLEPSRMEAAKAAARDFVQRQPLSVLIGVVAFSDGGFTVQAPTNDQEAILDSINRLAPQRGTSLGQGIFASLNTIAVSLRQSPLEQALQNESESPSSDVSTPTPMPDGEYAPAVIVLFSDGENTAPPDVLTAAQVAADRGVRVHTVGIGSAVGSDLNIDGFIVHSQLDEETLKQISLLTDGAYYKAEGEEELHKIYENITPQLVIKPEKMEVTSIFAGASILVLLVGSAFSLLWFGRLP